jgi:hypothetical protein
MFVRRRILRITRPGVGEEIGQVEFGSAQPIEERLWGGLREDPELFTDLSKCPVSLRFLAL